MIRFFACFTAFLLTCCVVTAQDPSSDPVTAPAPPGVTTTESPEIAQFQKLEDDWSTAVNQHDQYTLENVLSPLFVNVSAAGDISTLNQEVAHVISNDDKTYFLSQKVVAVRMLGDTAVVNGTYTLHHRVNSREVTDRGVFTHVYERAHDDWQCIDSQRTIVKPESTPKQKRESAAGAAFHIPLFGH
jgi:ketosteroid isomerase-like protein